MQRINGLSVAGGALMAAAHFLCPPDPGIARAAERVPVLDFLGIAEIPSGTRFEGTTIGGLSGAVAQPGRGSLLVVSDDRDGGADGTPRLYDITVDLADGSLDDGDLTVTAVHALRMKDGRTLDALLPDPEGIVIAPDGRLWISSERDTDGRPQIMAFEDFVMVGELTVPEGHMPGPGRGVRNNKGFESLTLAPDGTTLWAAHESALVQDGPDATLEAGTLARVLRYSLHADGRGRLEAEYFYPVEPIANAPVPAAGYADSGLVEMFALDDGTLLALERSFSFGASGGGFTVRLFHVDPSTATPIAVGAVGGGDAAAEPVAMTKTLVMDLRETGATLYNLEAIADGPTLPDGRETLLIISDDNFGKFRAQATQFLAFAIER
ncbi:MAG: esterase-like activity of phytase family protein [Pseudomonadota bacterium]